MPTILSAVRDLSSQVITETLRAKGREKDLWMKNAV